MAKKLKFKTDRLTTFDINKRIMKRLFLELQKENKEILKSSKPDLSKLNERYF